jgi:hypothetical protein
MCVAHAGADDVELARVVVVVVVVVDVVIIVEVLAGERLE